MGALVTGSMSEMEKSPATKAATIPVVLDSMKPLMTTPAVFSAPLIKLSTAILSKLTLGVAAVKRQLLPAQVLLLSMPAHALPAASSKLPGLASTWYCLPASKVLGASIRVRVLPPLDSTTAGSSMLSIVYVGLVGELGFPWSTSTMLPAPLTTTSLKLSTRFLPGSTVVSLPGSKLSATGPWVSRVMAGAVPAAPWLPAASL